jgi:hypothetical protein
MKQRKHIARGKKMEKYTQDSPQHKLMEHEDEKEESYAPRDDNHATPNSDKVIQQEQHHGRIEIGLNFSLIPFTGWGNLAYALFMGMLEDKNASFHPILMQDPHPSAFLQSAPYVASLSSVLDRQSSRKATLMAQHSAPIPVLHAVDHMSFDATQVVSCVFVNT